MRHMGQVNPVLFMVWVYGVGVYVDYWFLNQGLCLCIRDWATLIHLGSPPPQLQVTTGELHLGVSPVSPTPTDVSVPGLRKTPSGPQGATTKDLNPLELWLRNVFFLVEQV